jgi:flavin-dependent thymidylate synthase
MMNVLLFDYTGAGSSDPARHASNVLLFTKSTRLKMTPDLMLEISKATQEEVLLGLRLMAETNPGSWEFIHFSFLITGVTRSFTHQLVRTRQASYAQQSLRVVEIKDIEYEIGPSIAKDRNVIGAYKNTIDNSFQCYKFLIDSGVEIEDARGVLPLNIHTNICMNVNMRNFISLAKKRTSGRAQREYRNVMEACIIEIEKIYPWFHIFYKKDQMTAYKELLDLLYDNDKLTQEEKLAMYKKIDLIKSGIE